MTFLETPAAGRILYNTPVTALLFDFGGTLDGDGNPWLDRFYGIYKEKDVPLPREDFARAFYAADDALPARHRLRGLGFAETVALQAVDLCGALGRPALAQEVAERFVADCRRAFARNRPVLERLRRRHRLGVVSNFYGNLDSVLASEGLAELFDVVADSGVVGEAKPAPGIFRHALGALETAPAEAVMIGDSIPRDMRGAEALGLRHALITRGRDRCCGAALSAASLPELEPQLQ